MRYSQLRAFHHVAIAGGFSRAAEMLGLTQPAISDQVRKLETEYDLRLFNRDRKQVELTKAGDDLLQITRRMFEVEAQAAEFLTESRELKAGRLSIYADSAHHILDVIARFRDIYPNVFVSVAHGNTETVLEALRTYEADVGVLGELPESREHQSLPLSREPIIAFAAKDSTAGSLSTITLRDLADLPLVMREKGSKTRAKIEQAAERNGLTLNIQIEAEGREAVREIVAASGGVGIVSRAEFGDDPRFVAIPISDVSVFMDEALICMRERQDSRLIRSFMKIARDTVAERG
ncbi:MAG: LysR substrate-binding domain-containing protein [Pseudomonadota bacterium]